MCAANQGWFNHTRRLLIQCSCACQITALLGLFLKVPAIFNVFSNFSTMCLLDNLVDSAICVGMQLTSTWYQFKQWTKVNVKISQSNFIFQDCWGIFLLRQPCRTRSPQNASNCLGTKSFILKPSSLKFSQMFCLRIKCSNPYKVVFRTHIFNQTNGQIVLFSPKFPHFQHPSSGSWIQRS